MVVLLSLAISVGLEAVGLLIIQRAIVLPNAAAVGGLNRT
jgi:ABC-type Mn2+/Zn2+ transport system permease subunit